MAKTTTLSILGILFLNLTLMAQSNEKSIRIYPDWVDQATIYEVNLRMYTPEGNIKAFLPHLDRLADMGIKILWFMPVSPIGEKNRKGSLGSYYSVKDYTKINPEFGTLKDFKKLVMECHKRGMKVIIDWVANHSAQDNPWVSQHPDWYFKDSLGKIQPPRNTDWWDVAQLNYDKPELRKAMTDAMKFWVKNYDIDGYRCDAADRVPMDFWDHVRLELNKIKNVFLVAEWESPKAFTAFDMIYGWELHHLLTKINKGEKKIAELDEYQKKNNEKNPSQAIDMYFVTNHDENSWNGTIKEKYGLFSDAFTAFSFLWDGMPLIYSGQEADLNRRLPFFEKDHINWDNYPKADFYTRLIKLKSSNKALGNGAYGSKAERIKTPTDDAIYAFKRVKNNNALIFIMNCSPNQTEVSFDPGIEASVFTNVLTDEQINIVKGINKISLPGFGFIILNKQ